MKEEVRKQRIKAFCGKLSDSGIDAAVFFSTGGIRYFTDFRMNTGTESVYVLTCREEENYFVPRLDHLRALDTCAVADLFVLGEDSSDNYAGVRKILQELGCKTVGFEAEKVSYQQYLTLQRSVSGELVPVDSLFAEQRAVKSEEELDLLRRAAAIADLAMDTCRQELKDRLSSGRSITESEMTGLARYVYEREGAEGASFDPFCMTGNHAWLPQRLSTVKRILPGDMCVFDMGTVYEGYCSDLTRTFAYGGVTEAQQRIYETAREAQHLAREVIRPGVRGSEIDRIARDYIAAQGYGEYFPHITGHGLGVDIHELPILDQTQDLLLRPGMVVTVEPGIYVPGTGASRTEDMVLVTESGHELLTHCDRELLL